MRLLVVLITALLTALPALATPPRAIHLSETLLGVNDTHLFVLRRIDDNQGYHHITQTDIILIARNRQTNMDDEIWPVMRVVDYGSDFRGNDRVARVEVLPLPNRVNPFDILLWRGARPLISPISQTNVAGFEVIHTESGALTIERDNIGPFELEGRDVTDILMYQSLGRTRATIPPVFDGDDDYLRAPSYRFEDDCSYGNLTRLLDHDGFSWIVEVTCDSEATTLVHSSMFLIVPKIN